MRACERSCRSRSLLVLALATGCDSGSKQQPQAVTGPAVPWVASTPPQLAQRAPAKAACRSSDLELPGQVKFIARLQGGIALVTIRNTGKRACRLTGRPARQLRQARRPGSGAAADPAHAVELPRGDLSGVEPSRPATGRGGRGHRHLGELVRPGRQGRPARPAERAANRPPRRPRAPRRGLQRRPALPRPEAAVDDRGLPLPAEPRPGRAVLLGRVPAGIGARASRCTAGAGACCASGSCSRTARARRRPSSTAPPTSSSWPRAAGSRRTS